MALKSGLALSHAASKELGTGKLLLLEKMELAVLVRDLLQRSKQPRAASLVLGVPRVHAASSARPGLLGAEAQQGASCAWCPTELGALDLDLPRAACGCGTEVG